MFVLNSCDEIVHMDAICDRTTLFSHLRILSHGAILPPLFTLVLHHAVQLISIDLISEDVNK